jgi:hypothetical protein
LAQGHKPFELYVHDGVWYFKNSRAAEAHLLSEHGIILEAPYATGNEHSRPNEGESDLEHSIVQNRASDCEHSAVQAEIQTAVPATPPVESFSSASAPARTAAKSKTVENPKRHAIMSLSNTPTTGTTGTVAKESVVPQRGTPGIKRAFVWQHGTETMVDGWAYWACNYCPYWRIPQ